MIEVFTPSQLSESICEEIHHLDFNYFPNPWNKDQWMNLRDSESERIYLIKNKNHEIMGFALFEISQLDSLAHLYKILVAPQYRDQKLAKKLMTFALKDLEAKGLERVYLEVSTINAPAVKLYKKFDFEILTVKRKFYSDGADAFAMQRTL